jgi:hypothetical protein
MRGSPSSSPTTHIYGSLNGVKTTLELPDALLRRVKSVAALQGVSMRDFIAQSLEAHLRAQTRRATPGWRRVAGKARGLDTAPVRKALLEFDEVDEATW